MSVLVFRVLGDTMTLLKIYPAGYSLEECYKQDRRVLSLRNNYTQAPCNYISYFCTNYMSTLMITRSLACRDVAY